MNRADLESGLRGVAEDAVAESSRVVTTAAPQRSRRVVVIGCGALVVIALAVGLTVSRGDDTEQLATSQRPGGAVAVPIAPSLSGVELLASPGKLPVGGGLLQLTVSNERTEGLTYPYVADVQRLEGRDWTFVGTAVLCDASASCGDQAVADLSPSQDRIAIPQGLSSVGPTADGSPLSTTIRNAEPGSYRIGITVDAVSEVGVVWADFAVTGSS